MQLYSMCMQHPCDNTYTCVLSLFFSVEVFILFVCSSLCKLKFCMTIPTDNKIENRWKWKPSTIHRVCERSFILIGCLSGATLPHPPLLHRNRWSYVKIARSCCHWNFPMHFILRAGLEQKLHQPTRKRENNYIDSLAESCRHRVKLFAIFLNLPTFPRCNVRRLNCDIQRLRIAHTHTHTY